MALLFPNLHDCFLMAAPAVDLEPVARIPKVSYNFHFVPETASPIPIVESRATMALEDELLDYSLLLESKNMHMLSQLTGLSFNELLRAKQQSHYNSQRHLAAGGLHTSSQDDADGLLFDMDV